MCRVRLAALSTVCVQLVAVGGCAGGGRLHLVETQTRTIDAHQPLVLSCGVDACYWYRDDAGRIVVAFRTRPPGALGGSLVGSIVLGEPPAGSAREYNLDASAFRAFYSIGSLPGARFRSVRGIAAAWPRPGRPLHVRCRLWVQYERFTMLLGWRRAGTLLVTADLHAVADPDRARRLHDASQRQAARVPADRRETQESVDSPTPSP